MLRLQDLETRIEDDAFYHGVFGDHPSVIARKKQVLRTLLQTFYAKFKGTGTDPVCCYFVPGRIEVLGKHTDYAGGHSLLMAIDRGFHAISRINGHKRIRLYEADPRYGWRDFPLAHDISPLNGDWSRYPMTVAKRLVTNVHPHCPLEGVDVAFSCDLPVAGGLSGSSALMIMTFFAIAGPNRLLAHPFFRQYVETDIDLAMYLACVENGQTFKALAGGRGVGTFGGSEDHTEILNGRRDTLSLFRFCPTVHERDLPYPQDVTTVVAHSGVKAEKTGAMMTKYNLAAHRATQVVHAYNMAYGTRHGLMRDILHENVGSAAAHLIQKVKTATDSYPSGPRDLDLAGRFRQFYYEDRHFIPQAIQALRTRDFTRLGDCIDASHHASARYLGNIVPEIDFLQRTAREIGAIAASGFGAGFGGSAYALVPKPHETAFLNAWTHQYTQRFPDHARTCHFFVTIPCEKATELFVPHTR
jgi:galactokinase